MEALHIISSSARIKLMAGVRIAERKQRDNDARRAHIISAARRIAESEGWASVTVRRLAEEVAYSQPVLYAHFGSREGVVTAAAVEGFQELGLALEKARKRLNRQGKVKAIADTYLEFAATSPALYEAMFSLNVSLPFDEVGTPSELHFAFSQLKTVFQESSLDPDVCAEVLWSSLHGIAQLTRTKRLPSGRQSNRVELLVNLFSE